MNVEIFTLCDSAADYGGRLSVLGVFDSIQAPAVPAVHPHCAVAARLRFEDSEVCDHEIALSVIDGDGRDIMPKIRMKIPSPPRDSETMCANLVLNMNHPRFPRFGEYSIDLAIDGQMRARLPFLVRPAQPMPKAA